MSSKFWNTLSQTIEDVYGSELGNLLHLPDADVDLLLPGVVQSPVEPLQDGRGLVLPGADDEGEPEPLPVLLVVTSQPLELGPRQEVEASLSLLPRWLRGQEICRGQATSQVGMAAKNGNLRYVNILLKQFKLRSYLSSHLLLVWQSFNDICESFKKCRVARKGSYLEQFLCYFRSVLNNILKKVQELLLFNCIHMVWHSCWFWLDTRETQQGQR